MVLISTQLFKSESGGGGAGDRVHSILGSSLSLTLYIQRLSHSRQICSEIYLESTSPYLSCHHPFQATQMRAIIFSFVSLLCLPSQNQVQGEARAGFVEPEAKLWKKSCIQVNV